MTKSGLVRLGCFVLAAAAVVWVLTLFYNEPRMEVVDNIRDPETGMFEEWEGDVRCASLRSFLDGRAASSDWIIEDDGDEMMQGRYEQAVGIACAGQRAGRAALVGVGSSTAVGLLVAGAVAGRQRR